MKHDYVSVSHGLDLGLDPIDIDLMLVKCDDIFDLLVNDDYQLRNRFSYIGLQNNVEILKPQSEETIISQMRVSNFGNYAIAAGPGLASLIGMWYTLQGEIEEAKELPKIDIEKIFTDEYPSKPDGHNWPRSYEQYKNQVGGLQEDMDAVYDVLDEYEELIKELQKDIKDLERRKRDK